MAKKYVGVVHPKNILLLLSFFLETKKEIFIKKVTATFLCSYIWESKLSSLKKVSQMWSK